MKRPSGVRDRSTAFLLILLLCTFAFQRAGAQSISANFGSGLVVMGADTSSSCSGTVSGALRFNTGTDIMEYCDGTNWTALGITTGTGTTCSATAIGILRYDISKSAIEYCSGTTWIAVSTGGAWGGTMAISGLTGAVQINNIDNGNLVQTWTWNSLTGGAGLTLSTTGTTATTGQKVLSLAASGTNSASGATTYGSYIANTHAGTGSIDVGLYATASGATNNYAALFDQGLVGIGTTAPQAELDVGGEVRVGNTGLSCSSSTSGALRYNSSSGNIEFCNGTAWGVAQCSTVPASFSFTNQTSVGTSTLITSNIVQVSGFTCGISAVVSGSGSPAYRVCSDSACSSVVQTWTSGTGTITSGEYVQLELTSSPSNSTQLSATIAIGNTSSTWSVTTGSCGSYAIGTVCADGTVYAGLTPDGNVPMYTTQCDYGGTYSSGACNATRTISFWDTVYIVSGNPVYTTTGVTNTNTGKANTATLVSDSTNGSYLDKPYPPAVDCAGVTTGGHSDWYLPAENELAVLLNNRTAIGGFYNNGPYWTSTEVDNSHAWIIANTTTIVGSSLGKIQFSSYFRCVRHN